MNLSSRYATSFSAPVLLCLALDARGGLWSFGDRYMAVFPSQQEGKHPDFGVQPGFGVPAWFQDPPNNIAATRDGWVWLAFPDRFMGSGWMGNRFLDIEYTYPGTWRTSPRLRVVAHPKHSNLTFIGPEEDALYQAAWAPQGRRSPECSKPIRKPAAGAVRGAAFDSDGKLYYTQSNPDGIAWADLASGARGLIPPVDAHGVAGDPFAIVLGPDYAIWWTEPAANRIGRLGVEGKAEYFDLPEGTGPEELAAGKDGRLYFTLRDKCRLGSIRALAVLPWIPAQGAGGSDLDGKGLAAEAGGWAVPLFKPRPERVSKYPKGKARQAFLEERNRWADQFWEEPQAAEEARPALQPPAHPAGAKAAAATREEAGHGPRAAADPALGAVGAPAADPGLVDLTPREQLAALDVHLGSRALEYILKQHGHQRKDGKSQFARPWSSRKALEALIAQGLLDAGNALARIRSPRHTFDRRGRYLTVCRRQDVGCCHHYGQLLPTDKFMVVTELQDGEDGPCHVVVNAYPVSPNLW